MRLTLFLLFTTICFSQKELDIEVVSVKSKPKITTILKNMLKRFEKSADTATLTYNLRQINLRNTDTIINRTELQTLKFKNYLGEFSKKNKVENFNNWFTKQKEVFATYNDKESPIGWISGYPVRKNVSLSRLDFFKNPRGYTYTVTRDDNDNLLVNFENDRFYKGSFTCDNSFNVLAISYENLEPYPFYYTSPNDVGNFHAFTSNWNYQKERVNIVFTVNKQNKIALKTLQIEEKLTDFVFKRFEKKGVVSFEEKCNFYTKIGLEVFK